MNKTIFFLITFLLATYTIFSQEQKIKFGVKAGLNISKFTPVRSDFEEFDTFRNKVSFFIGGFSNISLSNRLKLQPEVVFAVQGTGIKTGDFTFQESPSDPVINIGHYEGVVNDYTLVVPVMTQFYVVKNFFIEAGPEFNILVDRKEIERKGLDIDVFGPNPDPDFESFNFTIAFGGGFSFNDHLQVNLRYSAGITEVSNSYKTTVLNLGLGYTF